MDCNRRSTTGGKAMQRFQRLESAVEWAEQQPQPCVFVARDPQDLQTARDVVYVYDCGKLSRVERGK
jgi:hypothetical protein